jgi:small-conductance mechanosensitive channel
MVTATVFSAKDYAINLVVIVLATYLCSYLIRFAVQQFFRKTHFLNEKKEQTIESLVRNSLTYICPSFVLIEAISPFIDVKQLLVGAGVLGIVLGFGCQSLIKDFFSGFFIFYEGQFKQGDFVFINQLFKGNVEEVGLRATKLRDLDGNLITISNGTITSVINGNIEKRRINQKFVISYYEDPKRIRVLLEQICVELNSELSYALKRDHTGTSVEAFKSLGVTVLNANSQGYEYSIVGSVQDADYLEAVILTRNKIADCFFQEKVQLSEHAIRMTETTY